MARNNSISRLPDGTLFYLPPTTIYRLKDRCVSATPIEHWYVHCIPKFLHDAGVKPLVRPIAEDVMEQMNLVAELSARVAPWVTVYAAPMWIGPDKHDAYSALHGDGLGQVRYGGASYKLRDVSLLSMGGFNGHQFINCALHEAWHHV